MTITFSQIQVRTMILALLLNVCHSTLPAPGILGKQHHSFCACCLLDKLWSTTPAETPQEGL